MSDDRQSVRDGIGHKRERDDAGDVDAIGQAITLTTLHATSDSKGDPKVDDPTTWPQDWTAADIKTFLDKKLKPGAKVNYNGLALYLSMGDFESLNHNYLQKLASPTFPTVAAVMAHISETMFTNGFKIITSSGNWDTILKRSGSIEKDSYVVRTAPCAKVGTLYMVTCESGGGKTVDAIAAVYRDADDGVFSVVFYCLASDISVGITDKLNADGRNNQLIANLVAAMENVFGEKGPCFLDTLRKTTERIALGIVVDEAGDHPNVVRALCGVVKGLGGSLGLPANVTVRVAVAGTGIGCGSVPPGSLPTSYTLHHVTTGENVWKALVQAGHPLAALIEQHARGCQVIKNPRFARLLYAEISQATAVSHDLPFGARAALVESCLIQAAIKFKGLNGLQELAGKLLLRVVGAAVAAIQSHNTPPSTAPVMNNSTDVVHSDLAVYIRTYGMVVDHASWSGTVGKDMDVWGQFSHSDANGTSTVYLVSPPGKRYTLSMSQSAIFLLLLGLVPARSELSGEALESAVATLFPLLISAYRERTVGEMLSVFGSNWEDDTRVQGATSLDVRSVRYNGAGQGVLDEIETPASSGPTPSDVKCIERVDPSRACVFVNGPKYPFADVVVAIPNAALILVQCKDYAKDLTDTLILEEMHKMGHPHGKAPKIKMPTEKKIIEDTVEEIKDVTEDKSITKATKKKPIKKATEVKTHAQLVAEQTARFEVKQKKVEALAMAFKVPLRDDGKPKITYMFIGSVPPEDAYTARDNVCFGVISTLPNPLDKVLPFDTEKDGGSVVSELGSLSPTVVIPSSVK